MPPTPSPSPSPTPITWRAREAACASQADPTSSVPSEIEGRTLQHARILGLHAALFGWLLLHRPHGQSGAQDCAASRRTGKRLDQAPLARGARLAAIIGDSRRSEGGRIPNQTLVTREKGSADRWRLDSRVPFRTPAKRAPLGLARDAREMSMVIQTRPCRAKSRREIPNAPRLRSGRTNRVCQ